MLDFSAYPIAANFAVFVVSGAIVWWAGTRLARYADAIAHMTGVGSAFIGMLLLGGVTSLPEIAVTVTAGLRGQAALAINNLFGSVAMQVVIIAVGDYVLGPRALSFVIGRSTVLLQSVCFCLLLSLAIAAIAVGDVAIFGVGLWSGSIFAAALMLLWIIWRGRESPGWRPEDMPERGEKKKGQSRPETLRGAVALSAAVAPAILVAGFLLARTGEAIAEQTGLGASFIGVTLVGISTSMPEISTVVAAVRLKRFEMAFADIFGTNILNVALVFFVDIAYPGPPVLNEVNTFSLVAAVLGIAVTLLYTIGLVERRDQTIGRLGVDSWAVVAVYAGGLALLFTLR